MSDMEIMGYMFFILVILYAFGYVYIWVRKTQIEKKTEVYQKLLRHALGTRRKYIKTLAILDTSKLKLDEQLEELRAEKARLQSVRAQLREILAEIRRRMSAEKIEKMDVNIITQKKIVFGEHWKVLNNFRCRHNIYLQTFRLVEKEYKKNSDMVLIAAQEWEAEKGSLLSLYKELKPVVNLPDPRMSFSSSS